MAIIRNDKIELIEVSMNKPSISKPHNKLHQFLISRGRIFNRPDLTAEINKCYNVKVTLVDSGSIGALQWCAIYKLHDNCMTVTVYWFGYRKSMVIESLHIRKLLQGCQTRQI